MASDRFSTSLPPVPKKHRAPLGRGLARFLCVLLAIVGALPIVLAVVIRSGWAQKKAEVETQQILASQGITARFDVSVGLWPPRLDLTHLVIDATDGGTPFLTAERASVKPRLFALLAGKPRIDEIEIDSPRARVVVKDGKVMNLNLPQTQGSGGPFHAPFDVVALSEAHIDMSVDDLRVSVDNLDIDVTAEDDPTKGSTLEVAVRGGSAEIHRPRTSNAKAEKIAFDDDAICSIDARVRVEPDGVLVRRLKLTGTADLDTGDGPTPGCDLLASDKRVVEVSLSHFRVDFPKTKGGPPSVEGHAHVRLPVGVAERLAKLPDTDGWIGADADLRFVPGMNLPELDGHIEAHDIALDRYHFAQAVDGDVSIHDDIVKSPRLMVLLSGGKVTATDVQLEPFKPGIPLRCTGEVRDVDFSKLMIDLGVAQHPHVAWDLREVHVPLFSGTLVPVKLDADFEAYTPSFTVYDKGVDDAARQRLIGISNARVGAHLAIRDGSVQFRNARADLAHTHVEGGFVAIFFNGAVQVDVPRFDAGIEDVSPIATTPMGGRVHGNDFHMMVEPNKPPHLEADASITNYTLGEMSLGDITSVHTTLNDVVLDLKNVKGKKGNSVYAMPSGRVDFGHPGEGMRMDGNVTTEAMAVRDLMGVFHLDEDPRFEGIDAEAGADATLHVAVGGPGDPCGGGNVAVHATTHLKAIDLFGEKFDDGDAEFDFRWKDRLAGLPGGEIDVHAITLHKVRREKDNSTIGSVLGSVKTDIGGDIHGNLVLEGVPLSRLQSLGAVGADLDGTVSGIAQLSGNLDKIQVDADVDVSPVGYKNGRFGASQLHISATQTAPTVPIAGHTRCGGVIAAQLDKATLREMTSKLEAEVTGDLFGDEVKVRKLSLVQKRKAEITGALSLRKLEFAPIARALGLFVGQDAPPAGDISGEIVIDKIRQGDYAASVVRFAPSELFVERDKKRVALRPTGAWVTLNADTLTVSPLTFDLSTPAGVTGSITLHGQATQATSDPKLDFDADLQPLDLGVLVGIVPKLVSAKGTLDGSVHAGGLARDPSVQGGLRVRGGELSIKDVPGAITGLDADIVADKSELRISRATAKFAGGTVSITGRAPLKDLTFVGAELDVGVRGIRLTPSDGISVGFDADLVLTLDGGTSEDGKNLPHLGGDVTLTSFEYTRAINLASDLSSIGGKSKRTVVDTYDPSLDVLSLDVRVHTRAPLHIKNNLAEISLLSETDVLTVSGTNQRFGLRGGLKALPGGRFHLPFGASVFEVKQAFLRFDDPTRIDPNVDVLAESEYRRGDSGSSGSSSISSSARGGSLWRIGLHAYGHTDDLKIDMTSDPPLSQEDIVLLLTIGMTRAELDQLQAGALGAGTALEAFSAVSGASNVVKNAIPVIDDFRFGSAYSPKTGRTEPQVTVGKRITDDIRANVSTGLSEDRDLRANIQWRLTNRISLQGSYDNVTDVTGSSVGNLGLDLRWRLEFE